MRKRDRQACRLKSRLSYFMMVLFSMSAGLASRKYGDILPAFVREHAGDALWAAMVYFGLRMVFVSWSRGRSAFVALLFSWAIEYSQLIQVPWLNEIRSTTLGALVLGRGFLMVDLIRYAVGIVGAWLIDHCLLKTSAKR